MILASRFCWVSHRSNKQCTACPATYRSTPSAAVRALPYTVQPRRRTQPQMPVDSSNDERSCIAAPKFVRFGQSLAERKGKKGRERQRERGPTSALLSPAHRPATQHAPDMMTLSPVVCGVVLEGPGELVVAWVTTSQAAAGLLYVCHTHVLAMCKVQTPHGIQRTQNTAVHP